VKACDRCTFSVPFLCLFCALRVMPFRLF
jgi:hypothetical protein